MKTPQQIEQLLPELDQRVADELEDQDLDFKQWDGKSMDKAVQLLIRMAVCMANGGGGTVVFGVADTVKGRSQAVLGVPLEVDVNRLKKAVYDQTDPKIMPVFEELRVPEGTGRLLIMQIHPGMPPYTDTSGRGTVRIGKECRPLTGTLRRKIAVETGETDFTAETVPGATRDLLSPSALEKLRNQARKERAPDDLLRLSDHELLAALELLKHGALTRAGLLLAGKEEALQNLMQGYVWTWLRMESDTHYSNRVDSRSALPIALERLEELINADNPITTLEHGLFHFEYRVYPEIALREALLNALCHADYRLSGPIMVKQFPDRLEISNNGGFIAGITPENILHHQPAARNPLLVEALARLRLVNRSNLGVSRMFEALLIEGKEPPTIREIGESVTVTFLHRNLSGSFRLFVAEESQAGRLLGVDRLLILQYLLKHFEMDTATAARICQRSEEQARGVLADMEHLHYLERGGSGKGTYWTLSPELHSRLQESGTLEHSRRINWDAAKTRVLSILMDRAQRGDAGLSNREIRQITHYSRYQVIRLMKELMRENSAIQPPGRGKHAVYIYKHANRMD
ncbi:ATP-binding protein [Desulfurivibrio alkaliphilus]|uniref:Putative transcriptional regulator n=1 Tax=Desulfurivibrio alkaliphilus (strain DSM 19089 / UNIQEM U267 / AHT2) TaxID=589865 RepID=D6Z668_DESAT|nr:ATP-binding protein [Desulfurivibrio alkaliphilus]ADH86833.1 putative transcriptional regulator [Desulfurivibrio alkaliphilus AHT 2]